MALPAREARRAHHRCRRAQVADHPAGLRSALPDAGRHSHPPRALRQRGLLAATAPLRGRAAVDLRLAPFDYRDARSLHGIDDLRTAVRTYAVTGGIAAYARDMVAGDLPARARDFERWLARRVLSPAAPLFNEISLLLSEDPATSKARKLNLYHAVLAGIASGHHAHSKLTSYVRVPGASLVPIIEALVAAELVERRDDPVRDNRPTYHPADPLLRFHYAIIRPHRARLARAGADTRAVWRELVATFESRVLGPCFDAMCRQWTAHFASVDTLGGPAHHVGSTTVGGHTDAYELDVVVASDDAVPSARTVTAIGEAKAGQRLGSAQLRRLDAARDALGVRAAAARLLLFGTGFTADLTATAKARSDVELIDLDRLYHGS